LSEEIAEWMVRAIEMALIVAQIASTLECRTCKIGTQMSFKVIPTEPVNLVAFQQ
jgi:hypothetical protein